MPELPEVDLLVRHLRPLIRGKTVRGVDVRRAKVLAPVSLRKFRRTLLGAKFTGLSRRGKYLLFQLRAKTGGEPVTLLGHLGMTGRIYLARKNKRPPRHAAVVLDLGGENFIYEDTRCFGRLTLDRSEEHTSELQSLRHLVCRLLLEKKKPKHKNAAGQLNPYLRHAGSRLRCAD